MGMFDSIEFVCPWCKETTKVQSKVGECMLNTYSSHSVPIGIAADLKDTVEYCDHCEQSFVISSNVPDNVRVYADRITEE